MTLEQWLEDARSDAFRRKMPELADLLETLAKATATLRAADWNDDAAGPPPVEAAVDGAGAGPA